MCDKRTKLDRGIAQRVTDGARFHPRGARDRIDFEYAVEVFRGIDDDAVVDGALAVDTFDLERRVDSNNHAFVGRGRRQQFVLVDQIRAVLLNKKTVGRLNEKLKHG